MAIIENPISESIDPKLHRGVDKHIIDAIDAYYAFGLPCGSCTTLLLEGRYDDAFQHAHTLIKPTWDAHVAYAKALPVLVPKQVEHDAWLAEYALLFVKQCHAPLAEALSNAEAMMENLGGDHINTSPQDAVDEEISAMRANC
jgi:hypothetical protein